MKLYDYACGERISGKRVVALGFFDGVHKGHRALLKRARDAATAAGLPLAVFTFPTESRLPGKSDSRIYTTEQKLILFEELQVDEVILADFLSVVNIEAEDFVKSSLITDMSAEIAVFGDDYRFGRYKKGTPELLAQLMQAAGKEYIILPEERLFGERVSSTKIREYLRCGDMKKANAMLGSPYFISGKVTHGLGKGRQFGFPTVNTELCEGTAALRRGVYRSAVRIEGEEITAITNVGVCPTVSERELHAETYLLDREILLYGRDVRIFLYEFLRDEKKFNTTEELIMQIKVDIERVKGSKNGRQLD